MYPDRQFVPLGRARTEVRRGGERIVPDFAAGSYTGAMDFTSGFTLHLFPDHHVMLSSWCDVCSEELVAEGAWRIEAGSIVVEWKSWSPDATQKKFFVESHGLCESLSLFLTFDENKVRRGVLLVSKDKEGPEIEMPFVQRARYVDWMKVERELEKKKG